jgi:hypothetical protein
MELDVLGILSHGFATTPQDEGSQTAHDVSFEVETVNVEEEV